MTEITSEGYDEPGFGKGTPATLPVLAENERGTESREAYCWAGGFMNTSGSSNFGLGHNLARLTKEPPMPVLTECEDCLTISSQNTESITADISGRKLRPQITPSILQYIAWLPQARRNKILEIRKQLARGTYNLNERLDAVLEPLLKAVTTLDNTDNRSR
jgi:hypothetical protein